MKAIVMALLLAFPLCAGTRASASIADWTGAGTPVCVAPGLQNNVRAVPDAAGGAYIGWSDKRVGLAPTNIYLQRLGPDGNPSPGWPVDGLAVCTAAGEQTLNDMAPDGSGGVFLIWEDYRSGALADIYGHHVHADGLFAPGWPTDGLGIAVYLDEQRDPRIVSDGAGGVFAAWGDARTNSFSQRDIYAQHVNGDGSLVAGWAPNGMPVTHAQSYDWNPEMAADPDGGVYITWTRDLGPEDIWAQHLGASGAPVATWPDTGYAICAAANDQSGASVVSAPGGGAMAVWKDSRDFTSGNTEADYYALRFGPDTSRAVGWPRDGRLLYGNTRGKSLPTAVTDGAGGMLFMWGELVGATNEDLFVMHADSSGIVVTSIDFPDGVVAACPDTLYQDPASIAADGAGGAFVSWTDYRDAGPSFTNPDPYVQHVEGGAKLAAGWPAKGVALTQTTTAETLPLAVAVPGGSVIAVWARGSGSNADLFASLVGNDGVVPVLVSLVSSEVTSDRVRLTWQLAGAASEEWRLERRGESAAWSEIARAFPDGSGRLTVTDEAVTAGLRYAYRLSPAAGGAAIGEAWIEVPLGTTAFALRGAWPNPVTGAASVRFALPVPGEVTLTLMDVQGRERSRWNFNALAGEQARVLDGLERLGPGLYWLRLSQFGRTASTRLALIR